MILVRNHPRLTVESCRGWSGCRTGVGVMCAVLPPEVDCPDKAPRNYDVDSPCRENRKLCGGRASQRHENAHLETFEALELDENQFMVGAAGRSLDVLMSRLMIEHDWKILPYRAE